MKLYIALFVALLIVACGYEKPTTTQKTASPGVSFVKASFDEAAAQAQEAEKMMLVDFYAVWCGPCKRLDRTVFKDQEAGKYIDANFVSLKIDGEKGEGPALMKKFGIGGFPTVMIFNKDGEEIDRIVGFGGDREEYLQTVRNYVNGKETLTDFLNRFEENPKDAELAFDIAHKYTLRNQDDLAAEYYQQAMKLDPDNQHGFHEEIKYRLSSYTLTTGNTGEMQKYIASLSDDSKYLERSYNALIRHYRRQNDAESAVQTYEAALARIDENANLMNAYAWYIFQSQLSDHYQRGIEVAQRAVEIRPDAHAIWDTLGQLHFANGNVPAAITAMEKAVELDPEEESYRENLETYRKSIS